MKVSAVIGKNFGDEGKGLATDFLALKAMQSDESAIVVRHNGGAQAGHTVEMPKIRFVYSQFSSGSFRDADTYWGGNFLPDLFKLGEEAALLSKLMELPTIYADPSCRIVTIIDVLINMAAEYDLGDKRHGSCGMGIYETVKRSETIKLGLGDVLSWDTEKLYKALLGIRKFYVPVRLKELGIKDNNPYVDLIFDDNVLYNASETMARNAGLVTLASPEILKDFDHVIFEGAQGLLLDEDRQEFAPHLTASKTGLTYPREILKSIGIEEKINAYYVTRAYVTRHGAGPLPYKVNLDYPDTTNIPNEWQGELRFALHGTKEEFCEPVIADMGSEGDAEPNLIITHLNETDGRILTSSGYTDVDMFTEGMIFKEIHKSYSKYAEEID